MDPYASSLADEIIRYLHRSSCSPFKTVPLCMGSNHALPQHIQTRGRSVFGARRFISVLRTHPHPVLTTVEPRLPRMELRLLVMEPCHLFRRCHVISSAGAMSSLPQLIIPSSRVCCQHLMHSDARDAQRRSAGRDCEHPPSISILADDELSIGCDGLLIAGLHE